MRIKLTITGLLAGAAFAAPVSAQEPARIRYESFQLANGLNVILAPDPSTQVVAVDVLYRAGSRNEQKGRTGFAHLFEHMMFQGSENVPKGGHFQMVGNAGGVMNGFTTEDRTEYFNILPSNRLNLGLWLEADRMRSLAVNADNFANQRDAVKEELRLRVDNAPYANATLSNFSSLADANSCFAYAHPAIGSIADLNAATLEEVKSFFDSYYRPNNATLVVAGDFDLVATRKLIEQYFGPIPRGSEPPVVQCDQQFNTGAISKKVDDPFATLPAAFHAYRIPPIQHADYPALVILGEIMGGGANSRLSRTLVRESKIAVAAGNSLNTGISGSTNRSAPRAGFGVVTFIAIGSPAASIDSLRARLEMQVARLAKEGVTPEELESAKTGYKAAFIKNRQQPIYIAEDLQMAKLFLGGPEAVNTDLNRYMQVSLEDIRRVATKYLRADNAAFLAVTPGKKS